MPVEIAQKIWMNGEFKDSEDCKIHIMSHVVHYGSSVFEGIRCYEGNASSNVFRLNEHMKRLIDSAKIYRMKTELTAEELSEITLKLINKNNLKACYIRPIIFRGMGAFGLLPFDAKIEIAIACWSWGAYLGKEALENGIDVKIATWNRAAPNTYPSLAKAGGNYLNSQLIKMEAVLDGYDEGIALDVNGLISEGSGENLFVIKNGKIFTPESSFSILPGITRHSIIVLARELGLDVVCKPIPREMLYIADELFFTGTAAEVTPIRSVDKITIGSGKRGEITKKLQDKFFRIIRQEEEDKFNWLTKVN